MKQVFKSLILTLILCSCQQPADKREENVMKKTPETCNAVTLKGDDGNISCHLKVDFKEVTEAEFKEYVVNSPELLKVKVGDTFEEKVIRAYRQGMNCKANFNVQKTFLRMELPFAYVLVEFLPSSNFFKGECSKLNPDLPKKFIMKTQMEAAGPDFSENLKGAKFFVATDSSQLFKISGKVKSSLDGVKGDVLVIGSFKRSLLNMIHSIQSKLKMRGQLINFYQLSSTKVRANNLESTNIQGLKTIPAAQVQY